MPEKLDEKPKVLLDSMLPTQIQWRELREGRNARYWCAAMLSLKVFPNSKNKEILKTQYPSEYSEFESRLAILLKRRESYGAIRPVGKGTKPPLPRNQYVSLPGVAALACELNWEHAEEFSKWVTPPSSVKTLDGSSTLKVSDVEFDKQVQGMAKGEQLKTVRYAAMVRLLRIAIDSPEEFKSACKKALSKRNSVSTQSLGKLVEVTVATLAKESEADRVPAGFGKDKNADDIAFAEKFAKTYF